MITIVLVFVLVTATPSSGAPLATVAAVADQLHGDQLLIPVLADGKPFLCAVDSGGGNVVLLDERAGVRAGLVADSVGLSGGVGPARARDRRLQGVTLQIDGLIIGGQTVVMGSFASEMSNIECHIGLGTLREYAVEFDYAGGRVRFFDARSFQEPPLAHVVPLVIERHSPYTEATMTLKARERINVKLLVDTGASKYSAVLFPQVVADRQVLEQVVGIVQAPDPIRGFGGEVDVLAMRVEGLHVGPAGQPGAIVGLVKVISDFDRVLGDGVLGAGFLRGFTVTFDYGRRRMFLQPNTSATEPAVFDASGLGFLWDRAAHAYRIHRIVPGSPGALADLREGDLLLAIDGHGALTLAELRRLLSRPGDRRVLLVGRGKEVSRVAVHLVDPFGVR